MELNSDRLKAMTKEPSWAEKMVVMMAGWLEQKMAANLAAVKVGSWAPS